MKEEYREELLESLNKLSLLGRTIASFAVLLLALHLCGLNLVSSILLSALFSLAVLIAGIFNFRFR